MDWYVDILTVRDKSYIIKRNKKKNKKRKKQEQNYKQTKTSIKHFRKQYKYTLMS